MDHTPRRLVRIAAATLSLAALPSAAFAAQASAATIAVDKPCYVNVHPYHTTVSNRPVMTVTGTGFGPNDPVDISGGKTVFDAINADANGNFVARTYAPTMATSGPGMLTTTVTATDQTTNVSAAVPVDATNLSISTNPLTVHNVRRDKVTYRFSGFTSGRHIVGFYVHNGKVAARSVFKPAQAPCGTLTQRALYFPGGRPAKEKYTVSFESVLHYSKKAFPRITGTLDLFHY